MSIYSFFLWRKGLKIVNANWIFWWKRGKIFLYSEVIQHFWRNWMIVTDLIGLRSVEFLKVFLVYFEWNWSNRFSSFNSKICETFTITCSWNFKVFFKNKLQKYSDNVILENSFRFAGKIELDLLFWPFYFHPIQVKKYFWTMTILNWNSWFQKFSLVKNFSRLTFSVGNNYQLKERLGSYKKIVWCRVALLHVLNDMRKKIMCIGIDQCH